MIIVSSINLVHMVSATDIRIVTNCVARHAQGLTNRVVELSCPHILERIVHAFVSKEVAFGGQGHILMLQEPIKLVYRARRRVLHQLAKEFDKRLVW